MVWPHSPSDIVDLNPIPVQKAQTSKKNTDNDDSDKAYRPPKRSNPLNDEAPEEIYEDDGEELEIETEKGKEIVRTKGSTMLLHPNIILAREEGCETKAEGTVYSIGSTTKENKLCYKWLMEDNNH